jgi:hypothetical protein
MKSTRVATVFEPMDSATNQTDGASPVARASSNQSSSGPERTLYCHRHVYGSNRGGTRLCRSQARRGCAHDRRVPSPSPGPTSTRIYYIGSTTINYANLSGGEGGELSVAGATFDDPYGLSIDPASNLIYWANEGNATTDTGAIAYTSLSGLGGGSLNPTAPVNHPQDPVIQSAPAGTGAPAVSGGSTPGSVLSCSTGTWAGDLAGGFFYQAPTTYRYQWNLNGAAIGGATAGTYAAVGVGNYTCTVTGSDQAGSSSQTSGAFAVSAPAALPAKKATISFKTVKLNPKNGTATILAQVSGPGKLSLSGKKIVGANGRSSGAQVVKLAVRSKGNAKKTPSKKGKVKVQVKVVFTPSGGGSAVSKTRSILLKKKLG